MIDISDSHRTARTCLASFYFTLDIYNVSICAQTSQAYFITINEEKSTLLQFARINLVNVYAEVNPVLDVTHSLHCLQKEPRVMSLDVNVYLAGI